MEVYNQNLHEDIGTIKMATQKIVETGMSLVP